MPFIRWIKDTWSQLANVGQIEGLMAFGVIVGLMLKLLLCILHYQIWVMHRQEDDFEMERQRHSLATQACKMEAAQEK